MALPPDDSISPFLNVFKDGCLVDSYCLDSRDSFVLGRHTNCDVPLAHPSISRHHLEIQLIHATHETRLTDMDSVHGTWINGKQIPSLTPYIVKEGAAIKLGASSRMYKIQWLHHPLPASSNEKSITAGTVDSNRGIDSNLSNTATVDASVFESSVKSNEACIQRNQGGPLQPARVLKSSDFCCDNRKSICIVPIEQHASLCSKHEVMSPHIEQEIVLAGGSVNGIETFNASISLQISQQKEGLPPLPSASRRTPFAPLSPNVASPSVKAKLTLAEKKLEVPSTNKLKVEGDENAFSGSKLWLRRCNSTPSPMLNTSSSIMQPSALHLKGPNQPSSPHYVNTGKLEKVIPSSQVSLKDETEKAMCSKQAALTIKALENVNEERNQQSDSKYSMQKTIDEENSQPKVNLPDEERHGSLDEDKCANQVCSPLSCSSLNEAVIEEEYPSDKENQEPACHMGKQSKGGKMYAYSGASEMRRKPLQPLILTPSSSRPASPCVSSIGARDESITGRGHSRPSSVVQNLDYMLQKLKGMGRSESHHEWHMVVDSTCLMDVNSFNSLKLLEGMKEVRLIIPQIVIRELDFSNRKDKSKMFSDFVLKWIESCMLKHPSWIHVQNSLENLSISASTPPVSPRHFFSASPPCAGAFNDLMSPTNGDHVLNCALLFSSMVFDGQVALLTNDTALKIKAMAEGIVCEGATTFCDSLLSPYSERFLWAGSIAHGSYWAEKAPCHIGMTRSPNRALAECNKRTFMFAAQGMASKKHQVVENLKNHCKQAQGLKVILS